MRFSCQAAALAAFAAAPASPFSPPPAVSRTATSRSPLKHVAMSTRPKDVGREDKGCNAFWTYATNDLGVVAPKVGPAIFSGGLRGIKAKEALRTGEEFITVPSSSALVVTTDQLLPKELAGVVDKAFWIKSRWFVRLALLLLTERAKGDASPLIPWILRLPKDFDTPLHWSDDEMSRLSAYPHMAAAVAVQRAEWRQIYGELGVSSPGGAAAFPHSEDDLNWGMEIAYSRAFSGPYEGRGAKDRVAEVAFVMALAGIYMASGAGDINQAANGVGAVLISIPLRDFFMSKLVQLKRYAITPAIDFANHRSPGPGGGGGGSMQAAEVAYNYFFDRFGVSCGQDWEAGQQVFISYGERSNDHLLQYYSFVEADNPFDCYELCDFPSKVELALGATMDADRRALLAQATGLRERCATVTLNRDGLAPAAVAAKAAASAAGASGGTGDAMLPPSPLPFLRLAVLEDGQLAEGRAAAIGLGDLEVPLSPENEVAALAAAAAVAAAELAGFDATAAAEGFGAPKKAAKGVAGARRQLAEQLCTEKRKVLLAAVSSLKEAVAAAAKGATASSAAVGSAAAVILPAGRPS